MDNFYFWLVTAVGIIAEYGGSPDAGTHYILIVGLIFALRELHALKGYPND